MGILSYNRSIPSLMDWNRDFDSIFGSMSHVLSPIKMNNTSLGSLACDVRESDAGYFISADVPGFSTDDMSIETHGDQIILSGERKSPSALKETHGHHIERFYGKFKRVFSLPKGADLAKTKARFENGVLHLCVPKSSEAKPQKIKIEEGQSSFVTELDCKDAKKEKVTT